MSVWGGEQRMEVIAVKAAGLEGFVEKLQKIADREDVISMDAPSILLANATGVSAVVVVTVEEPLEVEPKQSWRRHG